MDNEQSSAPVESGSAVDTSVDNSAVETTEVVEQPTSPAESTTAETSESEPSEPVETSEEAEPSTDEPAETTEQQDSELKGLTREQRAEYFKQQQAQNRKQIETAVDAAYQPQPVDELTEYYREQGYSDGEAAMLARDDVKEQRAQIAEAKAQISELNMTLATEAMEVVNTTPWLDSTNKATYDEPSANAVSQLYEMLAVEKDGNTGQIVNAKMTPKQFYSLMDQVRQSGAKEAGAKARKAAEAEMASVAPPTSTTNKRDTSFDEMTVDQQRSYLRAKGHDI